MLAVEGITRVVDQKYDLTKKKEEEEEEESKYPDKYDHQGNRILFENLSFKLKPGEILAIQGQSGVGKTQILRGLCQLEMFTDGYATLNGKQPKDFGMTHWRARVAYVQQKQPAIEGTPRELFKIFCDMKAQKQLQKKRAAEGIIESHSFKWLLKHLETIMRQWNLDVNRLDQRFGKLSGGEYQRMCLAMAVALSPDVLLLDEPTSALDHDSQLLVENLIKETHITCVWVTHSPEQALRIGDQLLYLERGAKHTLKQNDKKKGYKAPNVVDQEERAY